MVLVIEYFFLDGRPNISRSFVSVLNNVFISPSSFYVLPFLNKNSVHKRKAWCNILWHFLKKRGKFRVEVGAKKEVSPNNKNGAQIGIVERLHKERVER